MMAGVKAKKKAKKGIGYRQAQRLRAELVAAQATAHNNEVSAQRYEHDWKAEKANVEKLHAELGASVGKAAAAEYDAKRLRSSLQEALVQVDSLRGAVFDASSDPMVEGGVLPLVFGGLKQRILMLYRHINVLANPDRFGSKKYLVLWRGGMDDIPLLLTSDRAEADEMAKGVTLEDANKVAREVFSMDISTGSNVSIVTLIDGKATTCDVVRDLNI